MANKFLEKLKKENERLKKEAESRGTGGFEKANWFKPEMGDNMIRILSRGEDFPYVEMHVHYVTVKKKDGGNVQVPMRCLADLEKDCPLCDAYEKVVKADKERARSLLRRRVYLYNVINYKTRQVQPWAAGIQVHEQIMGYAADIADEDSNVFSEEAGRDWKLIKKKDPRKPGNLGINYTIRPSSKDTAIPEKVAILVEGAVDLTTLYPHQADDERKMREFLGESTDEVEADEDEDLPVVKAPPASVAKAKASVAAAKAKAAPKKPVVEDDEDEDDGFEEDEELGVDSEDDDLEAELRDLGV